MRYVFSSNWRAVMYVVLGAIGAFIMFAPSLGYAQVENPTSSMPLPTSSIQQPVGQVEDSFVNISYPYAAHGPGRTAVTILYAVAGSFALLGLLLVLAALNDRRPRKKSSARH